MLRAKMKPMKGQSMKPIAEGKEADRGGTIGVHREGNEGKRGPVVVRDTL